MLGCLHVAFMRSSLIIIEYALYLFSLSTEPKNVEIYGDILCNCATWSEYPLTTDSERHEKPIGIDIQKRSLFLLYSSQECTRRQKMTESIFTARLHTVRQKIGEKNVAKVWTSFQSHFLYVKSLYCSQFLLWFIGSQPPVWMDDITCSNKTYS
jgi:hypothetical protein